MGTCSEEGSSYVSGRLSSLRASRPVVFSCVEGIELRITFSRMTFLTQFYTSVSQQVLKL